MTNQDWQTDGSRGEGLDREGGGGDLRGLIRGGGRCLKNKCCHKYKNLLLKCLSLPSNQWYYGGRTMNLIKQVSKIINKKDVANF